MEFEFRDRPPQQRDRERLPELCWVGKGKMNPMRVLLLAVPRLIYVHWCEDEQGRRRSRGCTTPCPAEWHSLPANATAYSPAAFSVIDRKSGVDWWRSLPVNHNAEGWAG